MWLRHQQVVRRPALRVLLVSRALIVVIVAVQHQVQSTIRLVRQVPVMRANQVIQLARVKVVIQKVHQAQVRPVIRLTRINRPQLVPAKLSRIVLMVAVKQWALARSLVNRQYQLKLIRSRLHPRQRPRLTEQLSQPLPVLQRHGSRGLRRQVRQFQV